MCGYNTFKKGQIIIKIFFEGGGAVRKSVKVAPKTSSFNAYKGFFTFLRTVPAHTLCAPLCIFVAKIRRWILG